MHNFIADEVIKASGDKFGLVISGNLMQIKPVNVRGKFSLQVAEACLTSSRAYNLWLVLI